MIPDTSIKSVQDDLERDDYGLLTEATVDRIVAGMPKCPECGGPIDLVHFVVTETHKFEYTIDSHAGEINAHTYHYDTLTRAPDTTVRDGVDAPLVECESGHQWAEPRLKLHASGVCHAWQVLREGFTQSCPLGDAA